MVTLQQCVAALGQVLTLRLLLAPELQWGSYSWLGGACKGKP
jgi:hypothetical protein